MRRDKRRPVDGLKKQEALILTEKNERFVIHCHQLLVTLPVGLDTHRHHDVLVVILAAFRWSQLSLRVSIFKLESHGTVSNHV